MSQRNIKQKRRKKIHKRYIFIIRILFFIAVFSSIFLWTNLYKNAKKDKVIEKFPITATQDSISLKKTNNNSKLNEETDKPWNLIIVNNKNPIPENYTVNLVELEGGEYVDERIYEPLIKMLEDAKEGNLGKLPMVVSGYRTQEKQQSLYDDKIAKFKKQGYSDSEAVKQAKQWVAVPGYSEHQLGFAVDINGATYDVYLWLQENSYKYGFIFRYPGDKTDITGVAEEVWHYRYVGIEAAKEIYEKGICLEEYLNEKNQKQKIKIISFIFITLIENFLD